MELDDVDAVLARIDQNLAKVAAQSATVKGATGRRGSRFVGDGASESFVEHIAKGGEYHVVPNNSTQPERGRSLRGGLAFGMKALAEGTGSAGGYLVPVEEAEEVLKLLRARSAVNRLGPTTVAVEKELDITALSSGASAAWVAENAAIPVSEQTFSHSALLGRRISRA